MANPVTHLEKTIAGEVQPVTHLEKVIAEYGGGNVYENLEEGANIIIEETADGKARISASGEVSSEDTVARAEIAAIKDGETLDSFGDVETALGDKQNTISDLATIRSGAALGATAVQPETGKGLSTNDYTTAEKTKLAGIAEGAEVNVQSNWTQTTTTADDYIKNKPTLGTAAAKNATDTYNATGTDVTTGKAVAAALATLPEPMVFKGSLGTGGTITTLPTASSSNKGYVYKVITAGTYASQSAKVGDTFISDGSAWVLIPSGDEPSGTVTNVAVANGGGLTVSGSPITSSGTITVGHSNSVTAKTSSSLKKFTYDAYGHVTGSSELSTAESNALASGIDSTKVEQISTNENNISLLGGGGRNVFKYTNLSGSNNEVSYVTNSNGSITVTVASTTAANRELALTEPIENTFDTMKISGSPAIATGDVEYLITGLKTDGTYQNEQFSYNAAVTTINRGTPKIKFSIYVKTGTAAGTYTFYPMIQSADNQTAFSTFTPYIPTLADIAEMLNQ